MTATSAVADPFPPFYIGANLAPIPEDDEVTLFQGPLPCFEEKPTPHRHGTHHAVAKRVEKFPFRPPDKSRHEQHPPTAPTTEQAPLNDSNTPPTTHLPNPTPQRASFDLEALRQQVQKNMEAMDRWMEEMSAWPTTPTTILMRQTTPNQPSPPPPKLDLPISTPAPTHQAPKSDSSDPCNDLDRPPLSQQMPKMTTTTTSPSQPTLQQAQSSSTTPTPLPHLTTTAATSQPYDLTAPSSQITTQLHHQQLLMMMTITALPHMPSLMIDTLSITKLFQHHHHTLDYLEDTITWLSHSMAKLHTTMDHINHILQPMTKTWSININPTSNPKVQNSIPSPVKTTYPQQSFVAASLCRLWTPRVPPKLPHIPTLNNHSPFGHSDDQSMVRTTPMAIKWHMTTHCPISNVPFREKHTLACMRHKPHPSPRFLTLLHQYHARNYCPL